MGYALAKRALVRGQKLSLVTGPTKLTPPAGVTTYEVQTTAELESDAHPLCRSRYCDHGSSGGLSS